MRVLHLGKRFRADLDALARRGTPAWVAVRDALRELADERLPAPGPEDAPVDLPPRVVARRVAGANLQIAYVPSPGAIHLLALRPWVP